MKITFLGAAHEVTGSCTLLEACGKNILIDCGMEQGADIYENCEIPITPCDIDAVCLTHAHIDHSGKIPALVAQGFKGEIYSTLATRKLCNIMLRDSAHIQEFEAEWRNRKAKRAGGEEYVPLYTLADAENALKQFRHYDYNEPAEIFDGVRITFIDAGHLLGSASILFEITESGKTERVIFSGDLGNTNRPLINDPSIPPVADYVVIESTYGDRTHGARPDYTEQLTEILQETFDRGGNVVIPSFAIGRTQEMLYLIRNIKEQGLIKNHANFSVYVDSPLAVEATNIYSSGLTDYYDTETLDLLEQGIDPIRFNGLKLSVTSDDSKMINFDESPKVILSASGMCEAGRIRHHLKHNLWRADSTILFVGYQSEGTPPEGKPEEVFEEDATREGRDADFGQDVGNEGDDAEPGSCALGVAVFQKVGHGNDFAHFVVQQLVERHEEPAQYKNHPALHFPVSHAYAVFGTCTGQTHQVLRADVGSKDGGAYYVPGFSFSEQIVLAVCSFHGQFVFAYRAIDHPGYQQNTYCEYGPVQPNKFM